MSSAVHAPPSSTGVTRADAALLRAEMQQVIFAEQPIRSALLALPALPNGAPLRIRVHRNHGFELAEPPLRKFLEFAGYAAEIEVGGYDDSFSFAEAAGSADVELIWADLSRYAARLSDNERAAFLSQRVAALRASTSAPILVLALADDAATSASLGERLGGIAGVRVGDLGPVQQRLGDRFIDDRAAALTGTRMSGPALVSTAQMIGLVWIPAVVAPAIKAIAVDLDNTLYSGVLGEDGPYGISLSNGHERLQRTLANMAKDGMFIVVVSKNELDDVKELFEVRQDFPLRREHLSAMAVSWLPKSESIENAARELRISPNAFLFIDDNPGELSEVTRSLAAIHSLFAAENPDDTVRALARYPHLFRWEIDETDRARVRDLQAARERDSMSAGSSDPDDYLRALGATITLSLNQQSDLRRLYEMSHKTNQFNLTLARLPESTVASCANGEGGVVSIRLKDRLSDSGVIGSVIAQKDGDTLVIEDICVSCRALGRNIDDLMIASALELLLVNTRTSSARFTYRPGPRNAPARSWFERLVGRKAPASEWVVEMPAAEIAAVAKAAAERPVTVVVSENA